MAREVVPPVVDGDEDRTVPGGLLDQPVGGRAPPLDYAPEEVDADPCVVIPSNIPAPTSHIAGVIATCDRWVRAALRDPNNTQRAGQLWMNALFEVDRDAHDFLTGSEADPFYESEKIWAAKALLTERFK